MTAKTTSSSFGSFTPRSCNATPNGTATSWVAFASSAMPSLFLFQSMATFESLGKISFSSSSRLGHKSEARARHTRDVTTGVRETSNDAGSDRIARAEENDRDCFGCLLKSEKGGCPRGKDRVAFQPDQLRRE